jgi:hypothetical protein
MSLAKELLH